MAENDKLDPSTTSSDYDAMAPFWQKVDDIMGGAETMRAGGYLPQFESEDDGEYQARVEVAPFTNLYEDAFRNLVSKPFSKEVRLDEDAPEACKALVEDIDTAGSHLHVFAREVFKGGVNYAFDFILVDHPAVPEGATLADERARGVRPYWVRVPARSMLAVYQAVINGRLEFVHARIAETETQRDGFDEVTVNRVRVLNREPLGDGAWGPATWELWEEREVTAPGGKQSTVWEVVDSGTYSVGYIPLVAFVTGEHELKSWVVDAPLRNLVEMQITEFQLESKLERVLTMTAFPVGVVRGAEKPDGKTPMGPRTVFFFPPFGENGTGTGDFKWEEPSGTAAASLRSELDAQRKEMREAGMQPLLPQSGTITATFTAVAEAKAHSAVEMWALALKDALEQAWVITCDWLGIRAEQAPSVFIHTDFSAGIQSTEEMGVVKELHSDGLISGEARVNEAMRRGILDPNYDREADKQLILEEIPAEPDEEDVLDALPPREIEAA